eukprot:11040330-Ditylum_brightwellii.AAC.1
MRVLYTLIEQELCTVLEEYFPDILNKNVLLDGHGLGAVGSAALSGMYMEKNGFCFRKKHYKYILM